MKKIKILFTIPNFDTAGSGKVLFDIARSLDSDKYDVHICCFRNEGNFFKLVKDSGLKIHIFHFSVETKFTFSPSFIKRFFNIVSFFRRNKFDIIHSWHWSSNITEPLAAKLSGTKWIYTKKSMSWGNKAWKIKSKLADKIITINDEMGPVFFKNAKKIKLIPIGLDINYYKPIDRDSKIAENYGLEKDDFVLVSIANMVPVKGIELLIDAVDMLKNDIKNIKLLLVGDDNHEYGNFLKNKVREMNMSDKIHFVGKVLDVRSYHSIADIFVIPTKNEGRKEGMPMAPVEAMAAETLVIGSEISGTKYVLKEFPELLFEAGSAEAIVDKVIWLYKKGPEKRKELSKNQRKKVVDEYNMELFINKHDALYKEIAP